MTQTAGSLHDRDDNVIVARIQGGLGNQMFQFATAQALSIRHNCRLLLDVDWLRLCTNDPKTADLLASGQTINNGKINPRPFELNKFRVDFELATKDDLANFRLPYADSFADQFRFWRRGKLPPYSEPHYYFDAALQSQLPPLYIDGFWQSEKYFRDSRSTLVKQLTPRSEPSTENAILMERMQQVCAVSMHIRRGDFVSVQQAAAFHGTCSTEYYRRAIEVLKGRLPDFDLFVFSDDLDWVTANLNLPARTTFVGHNRGDAAYWDIHLMSRCKHHIVANSSFSWWGAWLNEHSDKIVVAPPSWFASPREDEFDVVPDEWIRVSL